MSRVRNQPTNEDKEQYRKRLNEEASRLTLPATEAPDSAKFSESLKPLLVRMKHIAEKLEMKRQDARKAPARARR